MKTAILKALFIFIILSCEFSFAKWLQGLIDGIIPQGEYYMLIHVCTIIAHIFLLGSVYVAIAMGGAMLILGLISKD